MYGALRAVSAKLDPLASRLPLAGRLPGPGQVTERYIGLLDADASQGRLVPSGPPPPEGRRHRLTRKQVARSGPYEAFGAQLRAQRGLARLTLRQLAELAQVSNPYLSQIERGLHRPSVQVIRNIADALGLPPERLLAEAAGLPPDEPDGVLATEAAIERGSPARCRGRRRCSPSTGR